MEKRMCPECGEVITGRIDKKFCSDMCRNAFNNKQNSDTTNFVRNINNALRKNRRILEENLKGETTNISKQKLAEKGFNFKYYTNQFISTTHFTYFFCYEFGYRYLDKDMVMIVKSKFEN